MRNATVGTERLLHVLPIWERIQEENRWFLLLGQPYYPR